MANDDAGRLEVLEAVKAGQTPNYEKFKTNFSEDEQVRLLEYLKTKQRPKVAPITSRTTYSGKTGEPFADEADPAEVAARESGIETRKPLGMERVKGSFALDEEAEADYYSRALSEKMGAPVKVALINGRPTYTDPTTGGLVDVKGFGLDPQDFLEVGRALPPLGALAPAPVRGLGVLPSAAGSGTGAGIGEMVRAGMGELMGVNPDMEWGDVVSSAASEGVFEMGAGTVSGGAMRLLNRIGTGPRVLKPEEAEEILAKGASAEGVVDEMRKRGFDIKASPAQLADMKDLLATRAAIAEGQFGPKAAKVLEERQARNDEETARFFNELLGPKGRMQTRQQVGASLKQRARTIERMAISEPSEAGAKLRAGLEKQVTDFGALNEPLTGKEIRGGLQRLLTQAETKETAAWDKAREMMGYNAETASSKVRIPVSEDLQTTLNALFAEKDMALFAGQAAGKKGAIPQIVGNGMDLNQLQAGLSYARSATRKIMRANDPSLPQARDLLRVKRGLEQARDEALAKSNPELLTQIKAAETATSDKYAAYRRGVVGDILREGDAALKDGQVFRELFRPNNREAAAEVAQTLAGDAQATSAARKHILSFYRDEVMQNGKVSGQLHKRFMERYGDTIDPFLSPLERKQLSGTGNLIEAVENTEARLAARAKAFQSTLEGRLQRMNSESVVEGIFAKTRNEGGSALSVADTEALMKMTKNTPMGESIREAVRDEIRRKVIRSDGKFVDAAGVDELLKKTGDFEPGGKLEVVLGKQYVDDLRSLRDTMQILSRTGAAHTAQPTRLIDLWHAIVWNPLSQPGAVVRRVRNIATDQYKETLARAISDPDQLRLLVKYGNEDIRNEKVATVLASMGAALPEEH